QAGRAQLALVPCEPLPVTADEPLDELAPDPPSLGETSRMPSVARGAVQRPSEVERRQEPRIVSLPVMDARVLHLPVNLAGTGWAHVNALRRKGIDARLLVFWPQTWRPDEYDINLDLPRSGFLRQQLVQWRALAKYLPEADIFHFYFGTPLVPKSLNVPILRAARKKSVMHFLGDDIRGKRLEELEYRKRFDAWIVGSYAA